MAVVYQHRRRDTNEVFYIGIGAKKNRAFVSTNRNLHWHNIVDKVGFEVDILIEGLSWENACKVEKGMITDYGRNNLGLGSLVNMTDGGEGTLNKMITPDQIIMIAEIGKKNKGRKHSEESKEIRRIKSTGFKHKQETKEIIGKTHKDRPKSQEHRDKIAKALTGRKQSPESIAKMLETRKLNKIK